LKPGRFEKIATDSRTSADWDTIAVLLKKIKVIRKGEEILVVICLRVQ